MPSHEEHCQDSLKRYGKRFDDLHRWLDEPSTLMGTNHRIHRHDPVTTPKLAKELFGEFADQAALDHIRLDELERRKQRKKKAKKAQVGYWKTHKYSKLNIENIVKSYWGDHYLEKLIKKLENIPRSYNQDFRLKRDKAFFAALFITGGIMKEVLTLKKDNFDLENKEARKYNAYVVKDMEVLKKRTKGTSIPTTRTFPIWQDDPSIEYLIEWVNDDDDNNYLFPAKPWEDVPMSYDNGYHIIEAVRNQLKRDEPILSSWFREQRKYYLIKKKGFSVYDLQAYFAMTTTPEKPHAPKHCQNLLTSAYAFEQEKMSKKKGGKTLRISSARVEEAAKVMKLLYSTNFLFKAKKGAILFREDNLRLISELFTPCQNEPQFITKIACLSNLFEVPIKPLKKLVEDSENKRPIKLVEKWLINQRKYEPNIVKTWENIITLRNAEPIHSIRSSEKASWVLNALNFFDTQFPVNDYSKLWDNILEMFTKSLESWQRILQEL
jgi:hypothetical protein